MPARNKAMVMGHSLWGGGMWGVYLVGRGASVVRGRGVLGDAAARERGEAGAAEPRRGDERDARRGHEVALRQAGVRWKAVHLGLVEEQVEDVQPADELDVLHRGPLVRAGGYLALVAEIPARHVSVRLAARVAVLDPLGRHSLEFVHRAVVERRGVAGP